MRNLQKRKANPNSQYWATKALNTWKEIINHRFKTCCVCGSSSKLQAHHIVSKRTCKSLMYDIDNGILLCPAHHNWFGTEEFSFSAHKNPLVFYHFLRDKYPHIYEYILGIKIKEEKSKTLTNKDYLERLENAKL